jgi:ABC-type dipeptide/oligopeptide/nickel transport system permease subunit
MFIAVSERDVFVMQNLVFIYATVFVLINIAIDLTIAFLDPGSACDDRRPDRSPDSRAAIAPAHRLAQLRHVVPQGAALGLLGGHRRPDRGDGDRGPVVAPYPPLKSDFRAMQKPPDEKHWFGTDQIGRDTLSRVIHGSRTSLTVAFGAVLFGTTLGALWGLACGYFGGRFDMASQRAIEFLQSFPDLILAMAIAMALGGGLGTVIVAIAITRIPFGGRVIRSVVLSLKEMQYVEAARGIGASHQRLMFRHILPQCVAPYLILATTHLGVAIVIEASLGFLGRRHPAAQPDLGQHAVRRAECRPGAAVVAGVSSRAPRSR